MGSRPTTRDAQPRQAHPARRRHRRPPQRGRLRPGAAPLQPSLRRRPPAGGRLLRERRGRAGDDRVGARERRPHRRAKRRPQLRRVLDDDRCRDRRLAHEQHHGRHGSRYSAGRRGRAPDRRLCAARPARGHDPRRLVSHGRDRGARARRRPRLRRPQARPHLRQHQAPHDRHRRRGRPHVRRDAKRRPLLGLPRRWRRQLRHRDGAHVQNASGGGGDDIPCALGLGGRTTRAARPGRRGRRTPRTSCSR